jgi:hypothetical protein
MTMSELKSIETTLIKISVRTFYYVIAGVAVMVWMLAMVYYDLMASQKQLLVELKKSSQDVEYRIKDIAKDVSSLDHRIVLLENNK